MQIAVEGNWIEGKMWIKGDPKKIKKFITENLQEATRGFYYLKDSKSTLVNKDISYNDQDSEIVIEIEEQLEFDSKFYTKISKKYDFDIEMYGIHDNTLSQEELIIKKGTLIDHRVYL